MYIHLGNNYVIAARDIIAILNIEKPYSNDIKEILEIRFIYLQFPLIRCIKGH